MAGNGLNYDHVQAARHDLKWASRTAETPADAEERRVASIDAGCQQTVNIVGLYKTVRKAYEERLVAQHKARFAESKKIFEGWLANAREILAKGDRS
jgi:hypothetical protein